MQPLTLLNQIRFPSGRNIPLRHQKRRFLGLNLKLRVSLTGVLNFLVKIQCHVYMAYLLNLGILFCHVNITESPNS